MPPSVPGTRLRELFGQRFPSDQLALVPQQKVRRLELGDTGARLFLRDSFGQVSTEAETLILATGRFLSGGLEDGVSGLREILLDLPVTQPDGRGGWYRERYMDPRGHAVNRAGIEVDERFRPLAANGKPRSQRLFAAGILLAHQDWIRQRCGGLVPSASGDRGGCWCGWLGSGRLRRRPAESPRAAPESRQPGGLDPNKARACAVARPPAVPPRSRARSPRPWCSARARSGWCHGRR